MNCSLKECLKGMQKFPAFLENVYLVYSFQKKIVGKFHTPITTLSSKMIKKMKKMFYYFKSNFPRTKSFIKPNVVNFHVNIFSDLPADQFLKSFFLNIQSDNIYHTFRQLIFNQQTRKCVMLKKIIFLVTFNLLYFKTAREVKTFYRVNVRLRTSKIISC